MAGPGSKEYESQILDLLVKVPRLVALVLIGAIGVWLTTVYEGAVAMPRTALLWAGAVTALVCLTVVLAGEVFVYGKSIFTLPTEKERGAAKNHRSKDTTQKEHKVASKDKKDKPSLDEIFKHSPSKETAPSEEPISAALKIDQLRLELGYGLLTLMNNGSGIRLTDQLKALRRQLASEVGFVMPIVRINDNMQIPANTYVIRIKETEVGRGDVRPEMLLVMDPEGKPVQLPGEATTEPAFGLPATWVDASAREEANFRGYTVVDAATVITTHLTELVKDNMSDLLSYAETQKLLDDLPSEHQKLIADIVPGQITSSGIQRVLQALLVERVSIKDLPTILEGIAEATGFTRNIVSITEHVRTRLGRQLCAAYATVDGLVPLITLSPEWEQAFAESLIGQGEEKQLAMPPARLQEFINSVRVIYDQQADRGDSPVLLTSPLVRPYMRSIIERFRPSTNVMSQNEIHPQAKIRTLGQI